MSCYTWLNQPEEILAVAIEILPRDLSLTRLQPLGATLLYTSLMEVVRSYSSSEDLTLVERAYQFAATAHNGIPRATGEPYIVHPLWVAIRLADLTVDAPTIAAGLLHDVVEDTDVTLEQIRDQFGETVARLVDGVTKLEIVERRRDSDVTASETEEAERRRKALALRKKREQLETLQKLLLTINDDARCVLIKLADRLHNMETIDVLSPERQERMALETREIYAPLAGLLGLYPLKAHLEDLAFKVLEPEEYAWVTGLIGQAGPERAAYTEHMAQILAADLERTHIPATVSARAKHLWSVYQKLLSHDRDISQIYDLYAVRAVVDTRENCYVTFGLIHERWHPVDGRFKDYIAKPKENGYQSIHTTVIGEGGRLTEFQIRSYEMHQVAEYGIASHFLYKQRPSKPLAITELRWLRQLLQLRQDSSSAREFVDAMRTDLFPDQVFVFTPQGEVKDLPKGSTPVDFAYRIHTEVGHHCTGARVNGRLVPLDYQLQSADVVEILTTRGDHGPSRDWLDFVVTATARQRIQQWFKRRERPENLARGRELLDRELHRQYRRSLDLVPDDILRATVRDFSQETTDDFYVAIGCGEVSPQAAANRLEFRLRDLQPKPPDGSISPATPVPGGDHTDAEQTTRQYEIHVVGARGLSLRLARCCSPAPEQPIVAFITRAMGATIHRADCPNILQEDEPERIVAAEWVKYDAQRPIEVDLRITAADRPGLLHDISGIVTEALGNIMHTAVDVEEPWAKMRVVFRVPSAAARERILSRINKMPEIQSIKYGHVRKSSPSPP